MFHDFRYRQRLGAGQYLSEGSSPRARWRCCHNSDGYLSGSLPRAYCVRRALARSEHAYAAGAHRDEQSRREAEKRYVGGWDRKRGHDSKCHCAPGRRCPARYRESAFCLCRGGGEPVWQTLGYARRKPEWTDGDYQWSESWRPSHRKWQLVPAVCELAAALSESHQLLKLQQLRQQ